MRKEDAIILMCHEVCEDLHINKVLRKNFFAYFYSWVFLSYNEVEKKVDELDKSQNFFDRWKSSFKYLNSICDYEEKLQLFSRLFEIFAVKLKNSKAPKVLHEAFVSLEIKDKDFEKLKDTFYKIQYFRKSGLRDYSNALLFSLMISYSNDGVLDESEFSYLRNLLRSICDHMPNIPIHSFDIKNVLAVNAYSEEEIKKLSQEVIAAIKSDGNVDRKELAAMKSVIKKMHLGEFHDDEWETIAPFLSLIILLADGEISQKEEDWFLSHYKGFEIKTIEQAFWLHSILIQSPKVFKDNYKFIKTISGSKGPLFDMTNMLFLTFAKHFLSLDQKRIDVLADFFKDGREKDVIKDIDEIVAGKVVEEEILLIINLVLNDRYDLNKINEYLNQKYIERVFKGIKKEDSKLKYLAICHIIFADEEISSSEYKALWDSFKESRLDPELLETVLYDFSLCRMKIYKMDKYYKYLS
ncbi:hypothetical protein BALOs_2553 [Halobacteriovorax sp. BALOs_7]|uniref:hypothetical protein n=1 Tax=unclassified Halobacteriovorax TaxID=2639665 RepID=UPI000EA3D447|nr:hypothetical protein [Halobacteriovorax sp. BALOs_7]AYF45547.1 hypothetical protein BALOs_2553 [Halobacteriovorax sp. BALOs_7]